ncbi:LysR family transcriptional regulator [Domibacillus antri]|uniref:LysR family transcriptional regulator n=1 Tax=Domibacillus antri TaxID=1714264 RepID=A0A1Q8Q428_9BACI|nr:LysR family transcriptional regulator [Domibacillus antri]OLN22052.1 LysR family transcriptional regulator [Domibacillus antri]
MEWHQIQNVIAVAKYRNFTKAAKQQSVSQPALSRSIMNLEEELGVPLFIRGKKEAGLTRFGEIFLEKAKQAAALMGEALEEIEHLASPGKGNISISFLPTLGPHVIPSLIAEYKRMYPDVTFQLFQGAGEVNVKKVQTGEADMCLTAPPFERADINWTIVREEKLYLTVPLNHPFANRAAISFKEASSKPFICFKKGFGIRFLFDEICSTLNVDPEITFEGEEVTTVVGFVAAGLGIAMLPRTEEIEDEPVHFLEINDMNATRKVALGTKKDVPLSPAAHQFHAFAETYITSRS